MNDIYVFFHNKKYICYFEGSVDPAHISQSLADTFGYIPEKISCVRYSKEAFDLFHRENAGATFGYQDEKLIAIRNIVVRQRILTTPAPGVDPEFYRGLFSGEDFQKIVENHEQWKVDPEAPLVHMVSVDEGEQDVVTGSEVVASLEGEYAIKSV
jgi:hypothetical protein